MITLSLAALTLAAALQQGSMPTDTTVTVPAGARLSLQNMGGEVTIRTWDRNQVRIQADHSSRTTIGVELSGSVLRLVPRGSGGMGWSGSVDYQLTVPAAMDLDLDGMGLDVTIEGTRGAVKVNTVEGSIIVRGPATSLSLTTVSGGITVAGARGRVELHAVSDDIDVRDMVGDLTAETVSGNVTLLRVDGRRVEAQAVSGDLTFEGPIKADGSYSFMTHSGDLTVAIPEGTSAVLSTAINHGDLSAGFTLPESERTSKTRQRFRMGGGGASVELETFSGGIRLVRPGEIRARTNPEEQ